MSRPAVLPNPILDTMTSDELERYYTQRGETRIAAAFAHESDLVQAKDMLHEVLVCLSSR